MNAIEACIRGMQERWGRFLTLLAIVGSITFLSLFLAYPEEILRDLGSHPRVDRFTLVYMPLSINPLHAVIHNENSVDRHRVLCPWIAYCLHLRGRLSLLVQWAANPFIYLVSYLLVLRQTRLSTAFATSVVLSLTLACVTSQTWSGYQDSMASLWLLLAMAAAPPPLSAACILVGMFADERILAVTPLVIFWHICRYGPPAPGWRREAIVRAIWFSGAGVLWGIGFMVIKHTSGLNSADFKQDALVYPTTYSAVLWPAWYFGLRGGWILVAALAAFYVRRREFWMAAAYLAGIVPILAISLVVKDRSRVASLAFPTIIIAVVVLFRNRQLLANHLLVAAMIVQTTTPIETVMAFNFFPAYPAVIAVPIDYFGRSTHPTTAPAP